MTRFPLLLLAGWVFLLSGGCGVFRNSTRPPKIELPQVGTVVGVTDQGQPATVDSSTSETVIPVPATSEVRVAPSGEVHISYKEPVTVTQESTQVSASTGNVNPKIAQGRIEAEQEAGLARHRMLIGLGLLLGGLAVAFVLPSVFRWPIPGLCVAAVGLILLWVPTLPGWVIPALLAAAGATVLAFYVTKHNPRLHDPEAPESNG